MPIYCYQRDDGLIFEKNFTRGEAPESVPVIEAISGKITPAFRDRQAEMSTQIGIVKGSKSSAHPKHGTWPMEPCTASGVHPNQAQDLRDHLKNHGCPTEITKDGDPIYESAAHRKKALKCRGMNDRNSFS